MSDNHSKFTGDNRAALIREFDDAIDFCLRHIASDGLQVPAHQRDWRIGATFSWHYVRIVEYRTQQLFSQLELLMARNKNTKKDARDDFSKYEFVRCELRTEDKKACKIWVEENSTQLAPLLHDVCASDYKFSLSFSSEHDTFTACLTGKPENPINSFKTLTARHKDWVFAVMTLLYKHQVMFRNGVWETAENDEDDGWA